MAGILAAAVSAAAQEPAPAAEPAAPAFEPRPVQTWLEAQIELHRRGFSCGSIDGVRGVQTAAALKTFQRSAFLDETGELDRATRENLLLTAEPFTTHTLTAEELGSVRPVPDTWLGKSEQPHLGFATVLELVAERYRANPKFLRAQNPQVNWDDLWPGTVIKVPAVVPFTPPRPARRIHVRLSARVMIVADENDHPVAHFPVSIARSVDKRPVGELHVTVVIPNPNYTFDPEVFPESEEGRQLGRRLIIAPGPNNPVGEAWIGLDRTGYGIHGTPDPEKVGRTESHGCFRLANWDARSLLGMAWVGMPVFVEP